jgi:protein SCO1/2
MSRRPFYLVALLLAAGGCAAGQNSAGDVHSYPAHGVIEKIAPDHRAVTIHHHAIPGYMMEMTMDFPVHDPRLLDGLVRGDQVDFTLEVSRDDAWVENIRRAGHTDLPPVPTSPNEELKPGDLLPDADFVTEKGQTVHLSDFRGQVVAFTFFFTRCPLPNYCPLMNQNLARTRRLLLAQPHAPKNWQFLSISFDPAYDTPALLTSFGDFYRAHDSDRWLFVAATPATLKNLAAPLGLMVMRQGSNISHNLRTIVVDPQGRLFRQFNGNQWTPGELALAIWQASGAAPEN